MIFTSGEAPPEALQKTLRLFGLAFTPAIMIGVASADIPLQELLEP